MSSVYRRLNKAKVGDMRWKPAETKRVVQRRATTRTYDYDHAIIALHCSKCAAQRHGGRHASMLPASCTLLCVHMFVKLGTPSDVCEWVRTGVHAWCVTRSLMHFVGDT